MENKENCRECVHANPNYCAKFCMFIPAQFKHMVRCPFNQFKPKPDDWINRAWEEYCQLVKANFGTRPTPTYMGLFTIALEKHHP